ncbi:MAG: hypothetical protein K0Q59_1578 [Paenibacillus sp.]|jgi:hypothetical protein|nr:hypothetical protein [Paenibacillus sp.]
MTTKTIAIEQRTVKEGNRLGTVMTVAAWLAFGIGLLTCLFNITNFSDQNMGLMVGVGCLVGSVFIYMIGAAIRLFHFDKAKLDK